MLDADLRRPGPQIAGVRERWNRERGKRRGRERRDEQRILPRDDRRIVPIHTEYAGAQTWNSHQRAVGLVGEASAEIEVDVRAGLRAGDLRAKGLHADLRLP